MANNIYGAIALIGGAVGALDSIDGTALLDKDIAVVVVQGGNFRVYALDATSGAAESSPDVIAPDTNAGTKRWLRIPVVHNESDGLDDGDYQHLTAAELVAVLASLDADGVAVDTSGFSGILTGLDDDAQKAFETLDALVAAGIAVDASGFSGNLTPSDDTAQKVAEAVDALAVSGTIAQIVNAQDGEVATGTTILPYDDTIPQNTEGDEYMSLAITPTKATNILKIDVVASLSFSTVSSVMTAALFQDSTVDAIASIGATKAAVVNGVGVATLTHFMVAGTTSSTTFKVRAGNPGAGTITFNGQLGARRYGGVSASSITITEIEA